MSNNLKIFQIGFNKCGTCSIHDLFDKYSIPKLKSIHWDYGKLAYSIHNNLIHNELLLKDYSDINLYSDMECAVKSENTYQLLYGFKYFYILDQQYPNSKFILNTRNTDNWINSRLNHYSGHYLINGKVYEQEKIPFYKRHMIAYNIDSLESLIDRWKYQWNTHHKNVRSYFKDRPQDLLIFDIEQDSFDKIQNFFRNSNISFSTDKLPHSNKTIAGA